MNLFDVQSLLGWVAQHAYYAGAAVFLVSLAESLAVVGLFIPGSIVMFGIGALVSTEAMDLWTVLALAATGAIVGDGLSYWLGCRYHEQLRLLWPFYRYPNLLTRGEEFFRKHGDKSVFMGRFIGPVRPIIPVVAGMMGMPPQRFYLVNILSALSWAPVYILPGVVFGASMKLAGAVATRLAVFVAILFAAVWILVWAIRYANRWLQLRWETSQVYMQAWINTSEKGHPVRTFINTLLNPEKSESRTLMVLFGLLVISAWGFFGILEDILTADPLTRIDISVYHMLQALRTPFGDNIMVVLTELGDAAVTITVVVSVLLWLAWKHAWRAAAYWLAAAGCATALTTAIKAGLGRARPFPLYEDVSLFSFPSGHATMSMVTYGFLAVLISRELPPRGRLVALTATIILVVMIAFSRLYLGVHWLSDVLGGMAFGTAWVAILGIAYSRHATTVLSPRALIIVAFSALLGGGIWHVATQHTADTQRYAMRQQTRTMAQQDWWSDAWQTLPAWRVDIEGDYEQPFTVQWAGSLGFLRHRLLTAGWQDPADEKRWLLWLETKLPAMQLPLLPHVHEGHYETFALIYPVPDHSDQRLVFRLWDTGVVLREHNRPVWTGVVTLETLRRPLSWFNLPHDEKEFNRPRQVLLASFAGVNLRLAERVNTPNSEHGRVAWDKQVMLALEPDSP